MLITNRKNTRFGKYEGFSTNLLIGEINSDSQEISIQKDIEQLIRHLGNRGKKKYGPKRMFFKCDCFKIFPFCLNDWEVVEMLLWIFGVYIRNWIPDQVRDDIKGKSGMAGKYGHSDSMKSA